MNVGNESNPQTNNVAESLDMSGGERNDKRHVENNPTERNSPLVYGTVMLMPVDVVMKSVEPMATAGNAATMDPKPHTGRPR